MWMVSGLEHVGDTLMDNMPTCSTRPVRIIRDTWTDLNVLVCQLS